MIIRGPGIPRGKTSKIPSTHIDVAPTLLEIAGVPQKNFPVFFDGRSLLKEWQGSENANRGVSKEIMNVEFWGSIDNAGRPGFAKGMPTTAIRRCVLSVSVKAGYSLVGVKVTPQNCTTLL